MNILVNKTKHRSTKNHFLSKQIRYVLPEELSPPPAARGQQVANNF